jgi:hypothetical protein
MVSHHFVYQLVLCALIWFFIILHLTQPKRPVAAPAMPPAPEPLKPARYRPNEPKPFEGLTQKPHCALCERDTAPPKTPPSVPPDPMPATNRRPREVDTTMHFCPPSKCDCRGWTGLGNLRANGHPSGGPWRQFHCTSCKGYFLETHGTIFHGKQASVERIIHVLACLAEDFLPFVNLNLSHFSPHLHDRLTTNPAGIIAGTMTQHGHQDTQESVANVA